jgi:hypothetical protein
MKRTLLAATVLAVLAAAAPAVAAGPTCLTPVAAHEPPCNPHLADSGWGGSHRGSYASGSSPYPAPRAGDKVSWQHVLLPGSLTQVPIIIDFSSPYPGGGRAAFMSVVSSPDVRGVHKVDVASGRVISSLTEPPAFGGALISGAYNLLDRDNHLFVGRARALDVFGDVRPSELSSPIAKLRSFALPDSALCGNDDRLVGITMTYDGHIAFASELGAVGVVPRRLDRLDAAHLKTLKLCGETVSNSISADETGGIYVVTSKHMHRVQWDGETLRSAWTADYETGGAATGVRLGEGSGSTPDVMGTSHDKQRFVVITDGQPLMHLVLFWRDAIPTGWQPIAPGKDRRIACEVPVTFGDPNATASSSEQSVLTSGYTSIIVNNTLKNEALFAALPAQQRQILAALAGEDPINAPYGLERIDWDPATRTCRSVWANRTVSIPNAVPTLSTASGLVYGDGQRLGVWGLEGVDIATGASKLRVDALPGPQDNSLYAATEVGPDGAIWQGVGGGIDIYRGPVQAPPKMACFDLEAPKVSAVRVRKRVLSGRATDTACGERAAGVTVRVAGKRVRVHARGRWRVTLRPGRYTVRAVDAAGQRSPARRVRVR